MSSDVLNVAPYLEHRHQLSGYRRCRQKHSGNMLRLYPSMSRPSEGTVFFRSLSAEMHFATDFPFSLQKVRGTTNLRRDKRSSSQKNIFPTGQARCSNQTIWWKALPSIGGYHRPTVEGFLMATLRLGCACNQRKRSMRVYPCRQSGTAVERPN